MENDLLNSNKYCNCQDACKLLIQANNQYAKVVQQNQSLQQELRNAKKCCGNCKGKEDYNNMSRHCENAINSVHKYHKAFDEIKKLSEELEDYLQGLHYEWALNKQIQEILQEFEVKDESKTHKTSA